MIYDQFTSADNAAAHEAIDGQEILEDMRGTGLDG